MDNTARSVAPFAGFKFPMKMVQDMWDLYLLRGWEEAWPMWEVVRRFNEAVCVAPKQPYSRWLDILDRTPKLFEIRFPARTFLQRHLHPKTNDRLWIAMDPWTMLSTISHCHWQDVHKEGAKRCAKERRERRKEYIGVKTIAARSLAHQSRGGCVK